MSLRGESAGWASDSVTSAHVEHATGSRLGIAVTLKDVRLDYATPGLEKRTVLDIAEWRVEPGDQLLLRGISGSGKSSLFNLIAGMIDPTAGEVWLDDLSIDRMSESERDRMRARSIGYVFQNHLLIPSLTALENAAMPLLLSGQRNADMRRKRASAILDSMGLADYFRHRPAQLSTGQRLRVAIARALVAEPRLVLADEPTAALDALNGTLVIEILQRYATDHGATLLVASHDPALDTRFSRKYGIAQGRIEIDRQLQ